MKIYSYRGKKGTRFVTDYELKIFAKVLHVNVEWLLEETEE